MYFCTLERIVIAENQTFFFIKWFRETTDFTEFFNSIPWYFIFSVVWRSCAAVKYRFDEKCDFSFQIQFKTILIPSRREPLFQKSYVWWRYDFKSWLGGDYPLCNVCPRLFWHSKLKVAEQWMEATLRVYILSDPCVINARLTFLCKVMVWRKAPVHK